MAARDAIYSGDIAREIVDQMNALATEVLSSPAIKEKLAAAEKTVSPLPAS